MTSPHGHWFWWALVAACLLWYSTVTIGVAIRGLRDIRRMLERLGDAAKRPRGPR
jgi:hypothetical protein